MSPSSGKIKLALVAVAGVGGLLVVVPALAAAAAPTEMTYTCVHPAAVPVTATPNLQVEVSAPASATPGAQVVADIRISQPTASGKILLVAPTALPSGAVLELDAALEVRGLASATPTLTPSAVQTQTTAIPSGTPIPAFPTPSATVTASPSATSVVLTAGDFTLKVTGAGATTLYVCTVPSTGVRAAATVAITSQSASGSPSPSPSPTPTPTPTPSPTPTPKPTHTVTVVVTKTPAVARTTRSGGVGITPSGSAQTGGGGTAGPDGRVVMLAGGVMILGAGVGGLILRRRLGRRPIDPT